jgi:hypothetical protein
MRKNEAQFCVRGDKQIAGVNYFESYVPMASWSTVQMVMNLAVQRGWARQQVEFSNAFVQADLKEEFYVELPEMFRDEHDHGSKDGVLLKLNKSLYGTKKPSSTSVTTYKESKTMDSCSDQATAFSLTVMLMPTLPGSGIMRAIKTPYASNPELDMS